MPHLVVEYSANLAERTDVGGLVRALHRRALGTGIAPLAGLPPRALVCEHYAVADEDPRNAFLAVTARLAAGRSLADRRRFLAELVDAVVAHLGPAGAEHVAVSVEYQEIDPDHRVNRNGIRQRLGAPS